MNRIYVIFPFDLRTSLDIKINYASKHHTWTAYVNNAGTLVHLVCPEGDFLVRLSFHNPVKHLSTNRMVELIKARTSRFLLV